MKIGDLFIKLGLQKGEFDKGIDDAKRKTSAFGDGMKKIGGMIAGVFAVGEIINFSKQSIMAYDASAKAEQALLTALKGRVSVQRSLIKQAVDLQGKTLFSDDETTRAQSLVAAFVKEESQIKKLIPLIQDMATAKQMDLASAADLVTKTFAGEMNALGRYGIQVEGTAGSAERLTMIQKGLNDAFGGQAEAAAKVGTGALTILANEYDNLQEIIGKLIISTQNHQGSFTGFLTNMTKGISNFLGKVSTWSDAGFSFTQSLVSAIVSSDDDTNKLAESMVVVKDKINDANKAATNDAPHKTYKQQLDDIIAIKKALDDELEAQRILRQEFKGEKMTPITPIGTPTSLEGETPTGATFLGNMDSMLKDVSDKRKKWTEEELQGWTDFTNELNATIAAGIGDAISTLASGLTELAMGDLSGKEFGSQILAMVGNFMVQLGTAFIVFSKLFIAFQASIAKMDGVTALGIGIALVGAGAAIGSIAKKGMSSSGVGASVAASGYSNYSQSSGADVLSGNVVFELEGTKLRGALNNADRRNQLIR